MLLADVATQDHELLRTVIVAAVGLGVSAIAFFVRGMAGDVQTAVTLLAKHETELAKLNLRMERTEGDVAGVRERLHDLANKTNELALAARFPLKQHSSD